MAFSIWWPTFLKWPFAPGIFIAILAFLAAGMTFWERPPRLVRVATILVFLVLVSLELWMIGKDQDARRSEHIEDLKKQGDGFEQTLAALFGIKKSVDAQSLTITQKLNTAKTSAGTKPSLRVDSLQLSKDILAFLSDHQKTQPSFPIFAPPETMQHDREIFGAALNQWVKETSSAYARDYQPRVNDVLGRLKARGADTKDASGYCMMSGNPAMLGMCATELAHLASQVN